MEDCARFPNNNTTTQGKICMKVEDVMVRVREGKPIKKLVSKNPHVLLQLRWKEGLAEQQGKYARPLTNKEKILVKHLLNAFGFEVAREIIDFSLNNWSSVMKFSNQRKISPVPDISTLYKFKDFIVAALINEEKTNEKKFEISSVDVVVSFTATESEDKEEEPMSWEEAQKFL